MSSLTGRMAMSVQATYTKTIGSSNAVFSPNYNVTWSIRDGVGVDQGDLVYMAERTLADGISEELDLFGGLTDAFGDTLNFARIKTIAIRITSGASNLIVGGAAANGFVGWFADATDKLTVPFGGVFLLTSPDAIGWVVTDATADLLKFQHDGTDTADITYELTLIGASA
jgi:hypothetical protein